MHVGLVVDAGWLDAVSVYILPKGRWLPGSSHALDLKSTRLVDSGCGMQLWLALLDGMGVRKVVAWVQSCTGSKVQEASWFLCGEAAAPCTIGRTWCPRVPEHVWFALGAILAQGTV